MRVGASGRITDSLLEPPTPMAWFGEAELAGYAAHYQRRGFTSALNSYRSLRRGWELSAAWSDRTLAAPALFIYGDRELVVRFPGRAEAIEIFTRLVPGARDPVKLPKVGHWVQLEAPDAVNAALLDFLASIGWIDSASRDAPGDASATLLSAE